MHELVSESYNSYGKQLDLSCECLIRYSEDSDSIRIFFRAPGVAPIYIPKTIAAYDALKKHFMDTE